MSERTQLIIKLFDYYANRPSIINTTNIEDLITKIVNIVDTIILKEK